MSELGMTEPVIDRTVFLELQQTAGSDFVAELVEAFAEEAKGLLDELQASWVAQDGERFRRAAHSLKSNGSTFGALHLADLSRAHEVGGLAAGSNLSLAELRSACNDAIRELKALGRD